MRPDGMVLDKEEKACYVLEFKRVLERYGGPQEQARPIFNDSMTIWSGIEQSTRGR